TFDLFSESIETYFNSEDSKQESNFPRAWAIPNMPEDLIEIFKESNLESRMFLDKGEDTNVVAFHLLPEGLEKDHPGDTLERSVAIETTKSILKLIRENWSQFSG